MGTPQLENGYIRIANELLEAIMRSGMNIREIRLVFVVIRHTYGYNRKAAKIMESDFNRVGLSGGNFYRVRKKLIAEKVIRYRVGVYQINKSYHEWGLCGCGKAVDNLLISCGKAVDN